MVLMENWRGNRNEKGNEKKENIIVELTLHLLSLFEIVKFDIVLYEYKLK